MTHANALSPFIVFRSAFSRAHHCQVHHLRQDCGPEAIEFYDKNLKEMSVALIQKHCEGFTYDSCVENQKGHSHTSSATARPLALIHFSFIVLILLSSAIRLALL